MELLQLREQLTDSFILEPERKASVIKCIDDGKEIVRSVKRGSTEHETCICLSRKANDIKINTSYFVGIDWIKENELAVQVSPKLNDKTEIDYVRMLDDALCEKDNLGQLKDLVTVRFDKPSILIDQKDDRLSIFLIAEFINILYRISFRGLKHSYYIKEENLKNKVRGSINICKTIQKNIMRGHAADNICKYHVYGIDSSENRILKRALSFCQRQIEAYSDDIEISELYKKIRFIKPYFYEVGCDVDPRTIESYKCNPIYKEYSTAIHFAKLILRRYGYDITKIGRHKISTPPFWIDMSKLFELYVFSKLKNIFRGKDEIQYHVQTSRQELDYLLKSTDSHDSYIIDAKYKPRYGHINGIDMDDARQVAGYARLTNVYKKLNMNEETDIPVKCLIIYPDQHLDYYDFDFKDNFENHFEKIHEYVRMYKIGIKLPEINF